MIIIFINCILPGSFSFPGNHENPEKCIIMAFNQSTWNLAISIWFRISHIGDFFNRKVFESWREIKIASNHFEFYLRSNLIPRVSQRVISRVYFFKIMHSRILFELSDCIKMSITHQQAFRYRRCTNLLVRIIEPVLCMKFSFLYISRIFSRIWPLRTFLSISLKRMDS